MKRLRYLVIALLLVSMVALTGCLPSASKIRGNWESNTAIDGNILKINFGRDVGFKIPFVGFVYSYKTTINWGTKQWIIDANAKGKDGDPEYCLWIGASDEDNALGVWKTRTVEEEIIKDFDLSAKLVGGKLYIDYLIIDNVERINNGQYGPEYLEKK